jgi:hypothetical protein
VAAIKGDAEHLDSSDRKAMAPFLEEIWELDPTMPFRQKIAMGLSKLGKTYGEDFLDEEGQGFRELGRLADEGDIAAATVLKAVVGRRKFI